MALFVSLPEYIRDVAALPLFDERILIINLYMASLALLLSALHLAAGAASNDHKPVALSPQEGTRIRVIIACTLWFAIVFFCIDVFHGATRFFFALQTAIVGIIASAIYLVVRTDQHRELLRKLDYGLLLLVGIKALLLVAQQFTILQGELAAERNSWSYLGILAFVLALHYRTPHEARRTLILALLLIGLNSTKGALVLLIAVAVAHFIDKMKRRREMFAVGFFISMVTSVVVVHWLAYQYGLQYLAMPSLEDLEYAGSLYRSMVNDQIASAVSRVFSVPYTLAVVSEEGALLGLGEVEAGKITFWGYPVHNLFVSYVAVFGVVGVLFVAAFLAALFVLAKRSVALCLVTFFSVIVANDLYAMTAAALLPLMTGRVTARRVRKETLNAGSGRVTGLSNRDK